MPPRFGISQMIGTTNMSAGVSTTCGWRSGRKLRVSPTTVNPLAMAEEVARVYSRSGRKASVARAIEMTKQLAKRGYVDPVEFAYSYAELGDKEQTFAWLEKAFAEKSGGLGGD
jgi:hypothetical protein